MKKYLFTALLFGFITTIYAQSKSAELYINEANLEWLETASAEFSSLVSTIESANEEKDHNTASKSKGDVLRYTYKSASTSQNLLNLISPSNSLEAGEAYESTKKDVNDGNVNLVFTGEEALSIKENTTALLDLKSKLKDNGFDIHPGAEHTAENIEILKQFSAILNSISASYLRAKNRS